MKWVVYCFTMAVKCLLLLLFSIFYRLRRKGAEQVPKDGGVILVANHISFFDPPLLQLLCGRLVTYTPRSTLDDNFFYRWITKVCAVVPLRRGQADLAAIKQVTGLLKQGSMIAMFPEQTRSKDGTMAPLKAGFHMLARRAKVPVVPIFIEGAYDIWPRQRKYPRLFGRLRITAGPPLEVADMSREDAVQALQGAFVTLGAEIRTA